MTLLSIVADVVMPGVDLLPSCSAVSLHGQLNAAFITPVTLNVRAVISHRPVILHREQDSPCEAWRTKSISTQLPTLYRLKKSNSLPVRMSGQDAVITLLLLVHRV